MSIDHSPLNDLRRLSEPSELLATAQAAFTTGECVILYSNYYLRRLIDPNCLSAIAAETTVTHLVSLPDATQRHIITGLLLRANVRVADGRIALAVQGI